VAPLAVGNRRKILARKTVMVEARRVAILGAGMLNYEIYIILCLIRIACGNLDSLPG
jgi:hypothetical protein